MQCGRGCRVVHRQPTASSTTPLLPCAVRLARQRGFFTLHLVPVALCVQFGACALAVRPGTIGATPARARLHQGICAREVSGSVPCPAASHRSPLHDPVQCAGAQEASRNQK